MTANLMSIKDGNQSIFNPHIGGIIGVNQETPDITTFRIAIESQEVAKSFTFKPGNFIMVSVIGHGEAPFAISSSPYQREFIEISVRRLGNVTQALHELSEGDKIGLRGPYGNNFFKSELRGKNLVFITGGIGIAPIRPLLYHLLEDIERYGKITIIFGARTTVDIPYKEEFQKWGEMDDVNLILTVDPGGETSEWTGCVDYVPSTLSKLNLSPDNSMAFLCGPPIMIDLSTQILKNWGFNDRDIIMMLENRMKCGIGMCGRCNVGHVYICKHGPVFTYEEKKRMPVSDY